MPPVPGFETNVSPWDSPRYKVSRVEPGTEIYFCFVKECNDVVTFFSFLRNSLRGSARNHVNLISTEDGLRE